MKRLFFVFSLVLLLLMVGIGGTVIAQDELPALADLTAGEWNEIQPAGETLCMYDTDYSFFVRPAAEPTDNLMIYFEGGGACWDGYTCGSIGQFASQFEIADNEMEFYATGMFDFENPANPVADYNVVFAPYCTGDIHTGDAVQTFEVPEAVGADFDEITVHFNGYNNGAAVLDWTYNNYTEPSQVLVTGCSAGGYGASTHAPFVMNNYEGTRVVHLADAANGVSPEEPDLLTLWGAPDNFPDFLDLSTVTTANFTTVQQLETANAFPDNVVAQYNTALDNVQVGFYGLLTNRVVGEDNFMEVGIEWATGLQNNLGQLEAGAENFHSYTAGGLLHCITGRPEFFEYTVGGVAVNDWVNTLLEGEMMDSVQCDIASGECFADPLAEEE